MSDHNLYFTLIFGLLGVIGFILDRVEFAKTAKLRSKEKSEVQKSD